MSALELDYRRALRWYPKRWRREHGDAMVGTLLDVAEAEGRDAPTRRERVELALAGLRARVGLAIGTRALDLAATVGLGAGSALAVFLFVFDSWSPWFAPVDAFGNTQAGFGPFVNPGVIVCAIWALAFVLTLFGRTGWARVCLGLAVVVAILLVVINHRADPPWYGLAAFTLVLWSSLACLGMVGRARRSRTLWITMAVTAAILAVDYAHVALVGPVQHYFDDRFVVLDLVFALFFPYFAGMILLGLIAIGLAALGRQTAARVALLCYAAPLGAMLIDGVYNAFHFGVTLFTLQELGGSVLITLGPYALMIALVVVIARRRGTRSRDATPTRP